MRRASESFGETHDMRPAQQQPIDVIAEAKKLTLPHGRYLVFGSGILAALGIRGSADIDLLVTANVFEDLKARGWKHEVISIEGRPRERVSHADVEAYKEYWCDGKDYDVVEMIRNAVVIDGVPFMGLESLIDLKRSMGREKDLTDIELIQDYLQSHRNQET
jgi:hypothetical protein